MINERKHCSLVQDEGTTERVTTTSQIPSRVRLETNNSKSVGNKKKNINEPKVVERLAYPNLSLAGGFAFSSRPVFPSPPFELFDTSTVTASTIKVGDETKSNSDSSFSGTFTTPTDGIVPSGGALGTRNVQYKPYVVPQGGGMKDVGWQYTSIAYMPQVSKLS